MALETDPTKASLYPTRYEVQRELDLLARDQDLLSRGVGKEYPGFRNDVVRTNVVATIAATTGVLSIPGPAAGLLRVFYQIQFTSQGSTPSLDIKLNPWELVLARSLSIGAVTAASVALAGGAAPLVLGNGETLDINNTGGAACTVFYSYHDIPADNFTLVRTQFNDSPGVLIPAAPTGFHRRWLVVACAGSSGPTPRPAFVIYNDDTANVTPEILLGSDVVMRLSPVAAGAGTAGNVTGPDVMVRAADYKIAAHSVVTARNPSFAGCYETVAD